MAVRLRGQTIGRQISQDISSPLSQDTPNEPIIEPVEDVPNESIINEIIIEKEIYIELKQEENSNIENNIEEEQPIQSVFIEQTTSEIKDNVLESICEIIKFETYEAPKIIIENNNNFDTVNKQKIVESIIETIIEPNVVFQEHSIVETITPPIIKDLQSKQKVISKKIKVKKPCKEQKKSKRRIIILHI